MARLSRVRRPIRTGRCGSARLKLESPDRVAGIRFREARGPTRPIQTAHVLPRPTKLPAEPVRQFAALAAQAPWLAARRPALSASARPIATSAETETPRA